MRYRDNMNKAEIKSVLEKSGFDFDTSKAITDLEDILNTDTINSVRTEDSGYDEVIRMYINYNNDKSASFYIFKDDSALESAAQNYLIDGFDELHDINGNLRPYVDINRWASDVVDIDGASMIIGTYDGEELLIDEFPAVRCD